MLRNHTIYTQRIKNVNNLITRISNVVPNAFVTQVIPPGVRNAFGASEEGKRLSRVKRSSRNSRSRAPRVLHQMTPAIAAFAPDKHVRPSGDRALGASGGPLPSMRNAGSRLYVAGWCTDAPLLRRRPELMRERPYGAIRRMHPPTSRRR